MTTIISSSFFVFRVENDGTFLKALDNVSVIDCHSEDGGGGGAAHLAHIYFAGFLLFVGFVFTETVNGGLCLFVSALFPEFEGVVGDLRGLTFVGTSDPQIVFKFLVDVGAATDVTELWSDAFFVGSGELVEVVLAKGFVRSLGGRSQTLL